MEKTDLEKKAREYIHNEDNTFFRQQVETLLQENNLEELNDRFYTSLDFGTGGLRGIIGGGYNRMNPYIVQRATQGLANYITKVEGKNSGSAVIAYDCRNYSDLFALEAAKVLCGNGIRTFLFSSLRPTPELSFAVRKLKATTGIVVTASHNPPEYNGYKVYWNDGAQVVSPQDNAIIEEVLKVSGKPVVMGREEAEASGMLRIIDAEIDDAFIEMVKRCALRPDLLKEHGSDFRIVFTPLHGAGAMPVERSLREMGVDVIFVPEQNEPDGNFPTVSYPNPEDPSAMKLALDLGKKTGADLVFGTDPDADRLGIAAPDGKEYKLITGNQLGALLADYILSARAELGKMPENPVLIKTIVTSELQCLIAESYGAGCMDTLTGFKYICEKIREFEQTPGGPSFVFGGEESYGYLVNTDVRDKDAVSTATMTVEMTLYHRMRGRSLFDQLKRLWEQYGYFEEIQISKVFKGQAGLEKIKELMERFRTEPPGSFGNLAITGIKDYLSGTTRRFPGGIVVKDIDLPSSNVIQFILSDKSVITARPSGTEPKIKFYASCRSEPGTSLEKSRVEVTKKIETVSSTLNGVLAGALQ